ncbi:MAG: amidohydrolase family protein, partial [Rhodospirillales bacterium]|nr:amidohydrolase family protein [Rhodospirillales bacterium]
PAAIEKILRAAGVRRALVSSSPDDGTLKLRAANPGMFVPMLRPYYEGVTNSTWHRENQVVAYMDGRLKSGAYKGVGEFHLWSVEDAQSPVVRRVIGKARERDLFVYVHSDARVVEAIFAMTPGVKVLWGHAGMGEPPSVVGPMLDKHKLLWTELSFRAGAVVSGNALSEDWKALLLRHPDRFMVGTDTYVTPRWASYGQLIAEHRRYLELLPPEVAKKIAWENAVRLFGGPPLAE